MNKRKGLNKIDGRSKAARAARAANSTSASVVQANPQTAMLIDTDLVIALRTIERVTGQTVSVILRRTLGVTASAAVVAKAL